MRSLGVEESFGLDEGRSNSESSTSIVLTLAERDALFAALSNVVFAPARSRRGNARAALRAVIHDLTHLYGVAAPIREALREDMQRLRISTQREYFVWLLGERYRQLSLESAP